MCKKMYLYVKKINNKVVKVHYRRIKAFFEAGIFYIYLFKRLVSKPNYVNAINFFIKDLLLKSFKLLNPK